ncbi:hypothetical protein CAXC1_200009 [Candidatus Xenohaliotis californiensis]|uniref:Uncharacterized protein n=1 Tax=Candidatus Xenohaliotis californiensis TaxID=84677 RepID=A0ABM9N7K4_9RICK|nr:hypothetical protein CAXC1_200009 [Candidatus Xenohaliotis californiensis]
MNNNLLITVIDSGIDNSFSNICSEMLSKRSTDLQCYQIQQANCVVLLGISILNAAMSHLCKLNLTNCIHKLTQPVLDIVHLIKK